MNIHDTAAADVMVCLVCLREARGREKGTTRVLEGGTDLPANPPHIVTCTALTGLVMCLFCSLATTDKCTPYTMGWKEIWTMLGVTMEQIVRGK